MSDQHKLVPCTKCGKPIRVKKTGLCLACYRASIAPREDQTFVKKSPREVGHYKRDANYHTTKCPKSPTGSHHWMLDNVSVGMCLYCEATQDFNYSPKDEREFVRR